jgi:hypothetical protein
MRGIACAGLASDLVLSFEPFLCDLAVREIRRKAPVSLLLGSEHQDAGDVQPSPDLSARNSPAPGMGLFPLLPRVWIIRG